MVREGKWTLRKVRLTDTVHSTVKQVRLILRFILAHCAPRSGVCSTTSGVADQDDGNSSVLLTETMPNQGKGSTAWDLAESPGARRQL